VSHERAGDLQAVTDRVLIEALRAEFTDAVMSGDAERLAFLFTEDGVVRMPHAKVEVIGRDTIRSAAGRLQDSWEYFVQTVHPGWIELDGDSASGRAYISEFGRLRDGSSHSNYGVYHDRYRRTPAGWKFSERVYELRYLDTIRLTGSPPGLPGVQ
jgi:ketosteroid isomerase-like protein